MKILALRNKEQTIINQIINNGGELDETTEHNLEITQTEIRESVDAYAYVIKKGIEKERQYWEDIKQEANKAIKRIDTNKERLIQQLHSLSVDEDLIGEQYTITPHTTESHEIDQTLVEENIGEYIVKISPETFIELFKNNPEKYLSYTRKILLKDLPENHKAIQTIITPTIKITKSK